MSSRDPFGGKGKTQPEIRTLRSTGLPPSPREGRPKDGSKTKVLAALDDVRLSGTMRARSDITRLLSQASHGSAWATEPMLLSLRHSNGRCTWVKNSFSLCALREDHRTIDQYHALAHLFTPPDVALHGTEFIANLVEVVTEFKLEGMTKAESRRTIKAVMRDHKIKTYRRTVKEKTEAQIVADLIKMHQALTKENHD